MNQWNDFYQRTEKRPPSALLARALQLAPSPAGSAQAIDLGCGAGKEAGQMLDAGWKVLAIDNQPQAIALTKANCCAAGKTGLSTWLADFEALGPLPPALLIHAGLSLPFCRPERFGRLWQRILDALQPGGVFAGHLFGVRHGWASPGHLSCHSEQDIRSLCHGLEIVSLRESEALMEGRTGPVNWHRFDLLVRNASSVD